MSSVFCVIRLSPNVLEFPDPVQNAIFPPVPCPSNTDELSIFCHSFMLDATIQSPTFQSVIPFKSVAPSTLTM